MQILLIYGCPKKDVIVNNNDNNNKSCLKQNLQNLQKNVCLEREDSHLAKKQIHNDL